MPGRRQFACLRSGLRATLVAAALAIMLTGCSGSSGDTLASKPPAKILAASRAAALSARSVHVQSKTAIGRFSLATDLELAPNGGKAKLSFFGLDYEAIRIGNTLYIKGNPVFYRRLFRGTPVRVPQGTWLEASADTRKLSRFAGLTKLNDGLGLILGNPGSVTKASTTTTVNGQPAIELKQTGKLFTSSISIAANGSPYPLQIVKHGRESGRTTFSGWNQPVSLTPPANAIDLAKLERR